MRIDERITERVAVLAGRCRRANETRGEGHAGTLAPPDERHADTRWIIRVLGVLGHAWVTVTAGAVDSSTDRVEDRLRVDVVTEAERSDIGQPLVGLVGHRDKDLAALGVAAGCQS